MGSSSVKQPLSVQSDKVCQSSSRNIPSRQCAFDSLSMTKEIRGSLSGSKVDLANSLGDETDQLSRVCLDVVPLPSLIAS